MPVIRRASLPILVVMAIAATTATATTATATTAAATGPADSWSQFGRTAAHTNNARQEHGFSPANVTNLAVAWTAPFGQFASGAGGAAVVKGVAYIGGSDGKQAVDTVFVSSIASMRAR